MAFPLFGGKGDEGGRVQQQLVHIEQLLPQCAEVRAQVYTSFAGGAGFPMQAELTGVDKEAAVQTVFV